MRKFVTASVLVAACAGTTFADSVDLAYNGSLSRLTAISYHWSGGNFGGSAGSLGFNTANATGVATQLYGPQNANQMTAFCIELGQVTNTGSHTYEVKDLDEAPNPGGGGPGGTTYSSVVVARLNEVVARAYLSGWITSALQIAGGVTNAQVAGIQLAIWEAIWETEGATLDLTTGTSYENSGNSAARTAANTLLAGYNNGGRLTVNGLVALTNGSYQDQIAILGDDFAVVPLPTAAWAGLGLLGVAVGVRRLRKA